MGYISNAAGINPFFLYVMIRMHTFQNPLPNQQRCCHATLRITSDGGQSDARAEASAELDQQKTGYVVSVQDSRDERHSRVDIGEAGEKEKKKKKTPTEISNRPSFDARGCSALDSVKEDIDRDEDDIKTVPSPLCSLLIPVLTVKRTLCSSSAKLLSSFSLALSPQTSRDMRFVTPFFFRGLYRRVQT